MNIDIVKKSIRKWDQIRNTELGLTFLTSGFGFEINKNEYNKWKAIKKKASDKEKKDTYIHLYVGILEFEIVFYLIDSISDKNKNYLIGETLFYKNFTKESIVNELETSNVKNDILENFSITDKDAATRAFKWFFFSNKWAYEKLNKNKNNENDNSSGVVRAFTIPFSDFKNVLDGNDKALLFFGLTNMERSGVFFRNEIEVILSSEKYFALNRDLKDSQDVTTPVPPFSSKDKNLNLL